ncbi:MAG: hypothetical protein CMO77_07285 [Verrucomicrobiales bacterium]|nr:hypothetical protein [Verrucomicrobiales bacterium]|tara:strand:- start:103 stop:390 length:288 start_codon:yes stop_codon:yes gene_type:complete
MEYIESRLIEKSNEINNAHYLAWNHYATNELPNRLSDKSLEGHEIDEPLNLLQAAMHDFEIWLNDLKSAASAHDPSNGDDASAAIELLEKINEHN